MSKQPLEDKANGIHRAKTWEIGFFSLNNMSTNLYMLLMNSISYYLVGIVGIGVVLAGSIVTIMRVWDGVTDPFVGMIVDKTNTKFGKNRPFIVIGNVILFLTTFIMFRVIPTTPTGIRFPVFIVLYMVYIIGYTCQCVVTKSAQTCLTNDPAQRPVFSMFDSVWVTLVFSVIWPILLSTSLIPNYTLNSAQHADKINAFIAQNPSLEKCLTENNGVQVLSGFYNPEMWTAMQLGIGGIAALLAILAIIGISRKDRIEYFGLGTEQKVGFKDYIDVLAHNRGIQMLVVSASTDKLASSCKSNTTVMVCLWGIIFGNYALYSSASAITCIPLLLLTLFLMNKVACKMGQKKALLMGTYGSMIFACVSVVLMIVGANKGIMNMPIVSFVKPASFLGIFAPSNWSILGVLWIIVAVLLGAFNNMAGNIVIPMTADCADYEVYRTGRYVPGLMGTLFSFVDKLISSLASTLVAVCFATIGFSEVLPTVETPYSTSILLVTIVCFVGFPMIGWICNIVSMHFYPLTKEKMAEIQDEIARIKAEQNKAKA